MAHGKLCARHRQRRLFLETLETRTLLAGDISVSVSGGDLIVRGDGRDNQVAIVQLSRREYAVVGFNGTQVEGSADPLVVRGVTGNIEADLKSGNDLIGVGNDPAGLIAIANAFGFGGALGNAEALQTQLLGLLIEAQAPLQLEVHRHLIVRSGSGRDGVAVIGDIHRDLVASLGTGNNALVVLDSTLGGDLIVRNGRDDDDVFLTGVQIDGALDVNVQSGRNVIDVIESSIGASARLVTGAQDDVVHIDDTAIGDDLVVITGSGDDIVLAHALEGAGMDIGGNVDIHTGAGRDAVELEGLVRGSVAIRTSSQADLVLLLNLEIRKNLLVDTGSGNDDLVADAVSIRASALVNTGSGADEVFLDALLVDRVLTILMGSGRDFVQALGTDSNRAVLRGGSGFDTLNFDDENLAFEVDIKQFESINLVVAEDEDEEPPPEEPIAPPGGLPGGAIITTPSGGTITYSVVLDQSLVGVSGLALPSS